MNAKQLLGCIFAVGLAVACSDDGGSGPDAGTGGTQTTGLAGSGGMDSGTGGKAGSGGMANTGGKAGTGGKASTGGASGDGGSSSGGSSSGGSSSGGSSSGGSSSGGTSGSGGDTSGACASGKKLAGKLVINEVFALSNNKQEPYDFIELYNVSAGCVDLGGLYFHDVFPAGGVKATIPDGTELGAGKYLVLTKGTDFPFGLSNAGDGVALFASDGTLVDSTEWVHPDADVSWGRSPNGTGDFAVLIEATPGKANASPIK